MANSKIIAAAIAATVIIAVGVFVTTTYKPQENPSLSNAANSTNGNPHSVITIVNKTNSTTIVPPVKVPSVINLSYPIHTNVNTTFFWIGEGATLDNGYIANAASAWDDFWTKDYGGIDDPNNRNGWLPGGFTPKENPFYFALPYDDFDDNGKRKADVTSVYWYGNKTWADTESVVKNHWIKITKGNKTAFAQWEDVGPVKTDDTNYVFSFMQPQYSKSGLDVSPAVRDYLGLYDMDQTEWQFVNDSQVPSGPWKQIITTSQTHWNSTSTITPPMVNSTNATITKPGGKFSKPLSFELWPSLYDKELPILKNKLIAGDIVILQTKDPTLIQQYKSGYFAPGVLVYSVYRSYGVDDIETQVKTLPAGYDLIKEDYESGPNYEPAFVPDETQALAIFHRCQVAIQEYNSRTGSHALLWITPSYRGVSGENWNWVPVRQAADILQVQTQPWQESDPSRSLAAAQHVDQTGGHDFIAQTTISGTHTVQGAVNLAQNLATVPSVKTVAVFQSSNVAGLQQILDILR